MNTQILMLIPLMTLLTLLIAVAAYFYKQMLEQEAQFEVHVTVTMQQTGKPLPLPSGSQLQQLRDDRSYRHLEATQQFPEDLD